MKKNLLNKLKMTKVNSKWLNLKEKNTQIVR